MRPQAVFIDFYGTLVHENGPIGREVVADICRTGREGDPHKVLRFWWRQFSGYQRAANEGPFENQYAIALRAFTDTARHFASSADPAALCRRMVDHWSDPPAYEESRAFLQALDVPYYLVTNADASFLSAAVRRLGIRPAGLVTSERARAYKPDPRVFELALREAGVSPAQAVHIGDSQDSDVRGAQALGIRALWLNRDKGRPGAPEEGFACLADMLAVLR